MKEVKPEVFIRIRGGDPGGQLEPCLSEIGPNWVQMRKESRKYAVTKIERSGATQAEIYEDVGKKAVMEVLDGPSQTQPL